jgi:hypothetical protein
MSGIVLSISEIRSWVTATLDAVEHKWGPQVELPSTFYWATNFREAFDLNARLEPTMGDLADDVSDIRKDLAGEIEERVLTAWHTLEHLKGILGALAALDYSNHTEPSQTKGRV